MAIGTLASVFGIVFLLVGISGFFAAPPPVDAPPLQMNHGHGMALGLFPINTLHNIVHLLFGALGLMAARGVLMGARTYFQFLAVAYSLLAVRSEERRVGKEGGSRWELVGVVDKG